MKKKFTKGEIRRYEWAIPYIKKEIADGRHPSVFMFIPFVENLLPP